MAETRDFLIGLFIGTAVGAAAAILYAPQAGSETRRMVKDRAQQAAEKTTEFASAARARTVEAAGAAAEKVGAVASQVREKADDISEQLHEVVEKGRHTLEQQRASIRSAVDAARQAYVEKSTELAAQEDTEQPPLPATG